MAGWTTSTQPHGQESTKIIGFDYKNPAPNPDHGQNWRNVNSYAFGRPKECFTDLVRHNHSTYTVTLYGCLLNTSVSSAAHLDFGHKNLEINKGTLTNTPKLDHSQTSRMSPQKIFKPSVLDLKSSINTVFLSAVLIP